VRTVVLMLDETIITETLPLYCCYGRVGRQVSVPITGSHKRRILHGAINVGTGDVVLEITKEWDQVTSGGSCRRSGRTGAAGTSSSSRTARDNTRRRIACGGRSAWGSKSACCRGGRRS
jgi:hypothetical protein